VHDRHGGAVLLMAPTETPFMSRSNAPPGVRWHDIEVTDSPADAEGALTHAGDVGETRWLTLFPSAAVGSYPCSGAMLSTGANNGTVTVVSRRRAVNSASRSRSRSL
jgi:hypothetical protein